MISASVFLTLYPLPPLAAVSLFSILWLIYDSSWPGSSSVAAAFGPCYPPLLLPSPTSFTDPFWADSGFLSVDREMVRTGANWVSS